MESDALSHQPQKSFVITFSVSAALFSIMTLDHYYKESEDFLTKHGKLIEKMKLDEHQIWQQKWIYIATETYTFPLALWTFLMIFLAINEYC